MKIQLFLAFSFIAVLSIFSSCEKVEETPTSTTYADVSSIISSNCAVSGCHNSTTAQSNVDCTSFASLSGSGGLTNILNTATNGFEDRVLVQQNMPPSGPLSQADRELLQKWVDNNYAEN